MQGKGIRLCSAVLALLMMTGASRVQADTGTSAPVTTVSPRIVNGLPTQDFPTTGALLYSQGGAIDSDNAGSWCSGTLIGCKTFLTAAHCVFDDSNASHYWVYLQHAGIFTVSSVTYNPSYDPNFSGRDVAIVKLSSQVTGIDPTTIDTTHDLFTIGTGQSGIIAGFGRTGGGSDYGVKRYGAIETSNCDTAATGGEGNDVLICWDYASPIGPAGTDSDTCNGDSGGPLFMDFSGVTEVVGVTSAGTAINCGPGDHSWDGSVYHNASWISSQLGADSTSTCGGLPPVGDPSVVVTKNTGTLNGTTTSASFTVNITGTPNVARFTLNGTDNGFNPNMFVKQGTGASASNFDCAANGTSVFGACQFTNPAAGAWSVFVQRLAGSGTYQVTTSVFGGDPPSCGNNIREGSEQCDGTDDGFCPGACQGDCTCPQTCSSGDLDGQFFVADAVHFTYKGFLHDPVASYASLDPRSANFELQIHDTGGSVDVVIPGADPGWIKADTIKRKYSWKGDGSLGGIRRVKLAYKQTSTGDYWNIQIKGREVAGAGSLNLQNVFDWRLDFDGTCHTQSW